jgi:hypothetical protein
VGEDFANNLYCVIALHGLAEGGDRWAQEEFVDGRQATQKRRGIERGCWLGRLRHGAISTQEPDSRNSACTREQELTEGAVAVAMREKRFPIDVGTGRS